MLLDSDGRRLHTLLVRLTLRQDVAEDLMQDLMIRLADSPTFAAAASPYAFARRTAVNLAWDWRRRHEQGQTEFNHAPSPLIELEQAEQIDQMLDQSESNVLPLIVSEVADETR